MIWISWFLCGHASTLRAIHEFDNFPKRLTCHECVYVVRFADFALGILILFGEEGRVEFLGEVGSELERSNARIEHRRAWADLLRQA